MKVKQKFSLKENKPHLRTGRIQNSTKICTVPSVYTAGLCKFGSNMNFLFFHNTNDPFAGFLHPTIPAYESLVSTAAIHPSLRRTLATY